MASACERADSTSSVRQPTAPGPAPANQTWPGSNSGSLADSRPSDCSRLISLPSLAGDERGRPAYSSHHERSAPPFATRLDDRRLLGGGGQGCLRSAAHG